MTMASTALLAGAWLSCSALLADADVGGEKPRLIVETAAQRLCERTSDAFDEAEVAFESHGSQRAELLAATVVDGAMIRVGRNVRGKVKVTVSGTQLAEAAIWFRLKGYGEGWVPIADVRPEQRIEAGMIKRGRIDLAKRSLTTADLHQAPEGKVAAKGLRRGEVLIASDLRDPPLVGRRQAVTVVLSRRGIRIEASGIARSSGWRTGEEISVEIPEASSVVRAKVIGEGRVHVDA